MKLKGKVCLITGAAKGIGAAVATLFKSEGAKIALTDVDEKTGLELKGTLDSTGHETMFIKCDVSNSVEVVDMVKKVSERFGKIDILINNAGVTDNATVVETHEENWDRVLSTNLKGIYLCSKEVISLMLAQGGGNVVNIGSIASFVGLNNNAAYNASKGGVLMLTRNMAVDFAAQNVRVNAVCPGMVMTPMLEDFINIQPDPEAYVKKVESTTPMGRIGAPEEVAQAVLFLAADDCPYITGAALMVDGGYTAR